MNDYIKRSEVLDLFDNFCFADCRGNGKSIFTDIVMPSFYEKILNLSSPDVVEVRHGEWKTDFGIAFTCSACNRMTRKPYDFCPHCGADMRGENSDKCR